MIDLDIVSHRNQCVRIVYSYQDYNIIYLIDIHIYIHS